MVRSTEHLRPRLRRTGGFFSAVAPWLLLLALAGTAAAQQPTRPDTTRRVTPDTTRRGVDTTGAAADTGTTRAGAVRPDTAAADTVPPPQLPELPRPVPTGFLSGVWEFSRSDIDRLAGAVTLADLLDLLPGIARFRTGYYIQPEAVSALGQTAGRVEVYLDGFEVPAVSQGSPDLARIALAEVDHVRVERRLDVLRIEMTSMSPSTPQPFAYIQAGIGQPSAKLFRGVFLAPHFLFGPVAFGVERLDSDGYRRSEPGNAFAAWGKWSKLWDDRGGIQAEFRTNTVHRDLENGTATVPWVGGYGGGQWVIRGRWQFVPGVVAEAYYGSTSVNDRRLAPDTSAALLGLAVPAIPDTIGILPLDSTSTAADSASHRAAVAAATADTTYDASDRQLGARLGVQRGPVWVNAAIRTHSALNLPDIAGDATFGVNVPGVGDGDVGAQLESWTSRSVTDLRARGRLGPYRGLSAFAEVTSGDRGAPQFQVSASTPEIFTHRSAWRAGVDLDRSWFAGGIARVSVTTDSVPGLGLPFDPARGLFFLSGSMAGWESHARVRLFWKPLTAEYSYLAWTKFNLPLEAGDSIRQPVYTPDQQWRFSLIYQQSPLKSGHLDLYARLDAHSRGVVYDAVAPTTAVPALNSVDFYMQIRILDVRIFFQQQNLLKKPSDQVTDFPAGYQRNVSSPRIFYGVRWQFFD